MKLYILGLWCIFAVYFSCTQQSYSQSNKGYNDTIAAHIESLLIQGDTLHAEIETDRACFWSNREQKLRLHSKLARVFIELQQFEKAYIQLQQVNQHCNDSALFYNNLYEMQLVLLLQRKYEKANNLFLKITENRYIPDSTQHKSCILHCIALLEQYQWDEAKRMAKKCLVNDSVFIDSLFAANLQLELKSMKTARNLSYFPGAGLFYAGKPGRGIVSLLLQLALITTGVLSAFHGYWALAYIFNATALIRLYFGGSIYAQKLVHYHNTKIQQQAANTIINELKQIVNNY